MKFIWAFIATASTLTLIWALNTKFGDIPPIGAFVNPSTGFWQNAESKNVPAAELLKLTNLQDTVIIKYDENRIPHIFAKNDHDLYLAQGYVTARDRLWEMDIQTRMAAGRLAEIIGPKAIEADRYQRRMGMVYGAENNLKGMMANPVSKMMVTAYTEGVNDYIRQLAPKEYPIEFKLLDYHPEEWKPLNCAFLTMLMSETLAGGSDQFEMTNNLKRFGPEVVNDLFPDHPFHEQPIIPKGTAWDFKPLAIPKPSATCLAQITEQVNTKKTTPGIGSNNWAITGSKSANGYPILANDPHLNLTFPSLWYQIQLSSPAMNVNGVSLPGSPCVIIGYNQKISWGVTNVAAGVLDWYQVKFKDNKKADYWYNNQWNNVKKRVEIIAIRGHAPLVDTVLYTHHGPVVYEETSKKPKGKYDNVPVGDALRWIAHDQANDMMCFYLLNLGSNYSDYRRALTYLAAPAQNLIFASMDNDIAITANGRYPLKFKDQGKFIMDGSDPANDWHGWIPAVQHPTVKNPARGFVSSANQTLTDQTYPYYINWKFGEYERAKRINDKLGAMQHATVDSMRIMQMDDYSIRAQDVLPAFLKYLDTSAMKGTQLNAYQLIKQWDKHYSAAAIGASIFSAWWNKFNELVWNDKFKTSGVELMPPSFDRTEKLLLSEPDSKWFDNTKTPAKETCADRVNQSFDAAVSDLEHHYGKPGKSWQWGEVKKTAINHLANLQGFGTGNFSAGGTGGVINALRDSHGPSWRMVVELGPVVKGYGVFPGGESGNPGSFYYSNMLQTWKAGKLNELLFLKSAKENSSRIETSITLIPGR